MSEEIGTGTDFSATDKGLRYTNREGVVLTAEYPDALGVTAILSAAYQDGIRYGKEDMRQVIIGRFFD